jgi:Uma2 family endonuclease
MTTTQTISKLLSFDDYISDYPDDGKQYELIKGKLVEMMRPIGKHEEIADLLPSS